MANSVYLFYRNTDYQLKNFEFNTIIPFLWQELLSVEILEKERKFTIDLNNSTKEISKIKIPKEIAINNLEIVTRSISNETSRKKKLREEFLSFIKKEVADDTDLEIEFQGLVEFEIEPNQIITDLIEFQRDHKKRFKYQKEKVSFRAIGYNPEFEEYSSVYQFLRDESEVQTEINSKRHQNLIDDKKLTQELNKKADYIFLFLFSFLLAVGGFLLYFLTLYQLIGLILIGISLGIAGYTYIKKYKPNSIN